MHNKQTKRSIGNETEARAIEFLKSQGYEIIARNLNFKVSEIDCIAFDPVKNEVVFIEIRGRRSGNSWENALESLNFKKQRKLALAIQRFIQLNPQTQYPIRVDFLCWDGNNWQWVKNLFLPVR